MSPAVPDKKPVDQETVDGLLPVIRGAVGRFGPPPEGATYDDVYQQAWVEALVALGRYRPVEGATLATYVGRVVEFRLRSWRQKLLGLRSRGRPRLVSYEPHETALQWADTEADREDLDPTSWLVLRRVPDWELVWAVAVEGYSFAGLAKKLGVPPSTAYDRYRRALNLLRAEW